MLGTLLKYDMKALSRVLIPVHIAAVIVGIAATLCFFGIYSLDGGFGLSSSRADSVYTTMLIMLGMTGMFCLFTLFAASAVTLFMIIYRFYRNLFSDEGYLTLTLPVGGVTQVASKVLAAMMWIVIDGLIVGFFTYLASTAGMGFDGDFSDTIPHFMLMALNDFSSITTFGAYILAGVNALLQALTIVLTAYAAFSLGSALANRHKVAAGIGLFFVLSWIAGLFHGIKSLVIAMGAFDGGYSYYASGSYALLSSGISVILYIITSALLFALCVYVLDRKTNLA